MTFANDGKANHLTQSQYDEIFSFISYFDQLSNSNKATFIEALIDLSSVSIDEFDNDVSLKTTVKVFVYFLSALVNKIESTSNNLNEKKVKSNKSKQISFDWNDWNVKVLDVFIHYFKCDQSKLWKMSIVNENFLNAIWSNVLLILENHSTSQSNDKQLRHSGTQVILHCLNYFHSSNGSYTTLTTSLLDSLLRHEHLSHVISDLTSSSKASNITLTKELLSEISNLNMNTMNSNSIKNIGNYLEVFCKSNASHMLHYLPLLMRQLDSPAHQIRSSLLNAMSNVIIYIHEVCIQSMGSDYEKTLLVQEKEVNKFDDEVENEVVSELTANEVSNEVNITSLIRTRESLLDILIERVHDVNYYTRANVLKIWTHLQESHAIPMKRFLNTIELAQDRLQDKTSIVRKQAMVLLKTLVELNPFHSNLNSFNFKEMNKELNEEYNQQLHELIEVIVENAHEDEEYDNEEDNVDNGLIYGRDKEYWLQHVDVMNDTKLSSIASKLEYCQLVLQFTCYLEGIVSKLQVFFKSKNTSDVIEMMKCITCFVQFQVNESMNCFQK